MKDNHVSLKYEAMLSKSCFKCEFEYKVNTHMAVSSCDTLFPTKMFTLQKGMLDHIYWGKQ